MTESRNLVAAAERSISQVVERTLRATNATVDHEGLSDEQFDYTFRNSWPRVLAVVRSMGGDAASAEDLVQEAFLRTWRERARLKDENAAAGFTMTVVVRLARNARRDTARRAKRLPPPAPGGGGVDGSGGCAAHRGSGVSR